MVAAARVATELPLSRSFQPRVLAPRQQTAIAVEHSASDDLRYLHALDQRIIGLATTKSSSFAELSRSCLGAWPGLIADRVTRLGLGDPLQAEQLQSTLPSYSPELHCGFGEWYFSSDTADSLTREFISNKNPLLFLGTPTLAQRALASENNFILVDSNPLVGLRFPELKKFIHYSSVEQLSGDFPRPSAIMLDAPWYLPKVAYWLAKASQFSTKSTTIVMPLFPSLTRPAAAQERTTVLQLAEDIGQVELVRDCISYDSPRYEWEALLSNNICAHPNWRRADLLIIREPSPVPLPQIPSEDFQEIWETYLIGSQVVRLRLHPMSRRRKFLVAPVPGTNEYILDSVSARDARRRLADIWTSRNRVAIVGDVRRLRYLLSIMSNSYEITSKRIRSIANSLLTPSDAEDLIRLLSSNTFH